MTTRAAKTEKAPTTSTRMGEVALALLMALMFGIVACSDDSTPDDPDNSSTTSDETTSNTTDDDNPFAVRSTSNAGTPSGETGTSGTTPQDVTPEVVVGREPKTLPKFEEITEHLGRLYLDDETEKRIDDLKATVEKHLANRWDLPRKYTKEAKAIRNKIADLRTDRFLTNADDYLRRWNTRFEKTELHLRGGSGDLLPKPFIGIVEKPYTFYIQAAEGYDYDKTATLYASRLRQLRKTVLADFEDRLSIKPKHADEPIKVMLLQDFKAYQQHKRISNPFETDSAAAHYSPADRLLVIPLTYPDRFGGSRTPEDTKIWTRGVALHEGVHQIFHSFSDHTHTGANGPMWCDEGVAELYGGHVLKKDGTIEFRKLNMTRVREIALYGKGSEQRLPFRELLTFTRYKQRELKDQNQFGKLGYTLSNVYCQGWALVYFMWHHESGKYRDKFFKIMYATVEDGDTGLGIVRRVFRGEAFAKLETEFHAWMDELIVANREGRVYDGDIHKTKKS